MNRILKLLFFTPVAFLLLSLGAIIGLAYIFFMPDLLINKWVVSIILFIVYLLIESFEKKLIWKNNKIPRDQLAPITILTLVGVALPFWTNMPSDIGFIFK